MKFYRSLPIAFLLILGYFSLLNAQENSNQTPEPTPTPTSEQNSPAQPSLPAELKSAKARIDALQEHYNSALISAQNQQFKEAKETLKTTVIPELENIKAEVEQAPNSQDKEKFLKGIEFIQGEISKTETEIERAQQTADAKIAASLKDNTAKANTAKASTSGFGPEVILILFALILLALDAFASKLSSSALSGIGVIGVLIAFAFNREAAPADGSLYQADALAVFFKNILLIATAGVLLMTGPFQSVLKRYLAGNQANERNLIGLGEYSVLPLFLCAGMCWIASATDFVLLFAALELTTIGFYIHVSAMRRNTGSLEAGSKYLVLGALSTGILVYGLAWLYGVTGSTSLLSLESFAISENAGNMSTLFALGLLLLALGFKIGAFPAHGWIPDVYQGAPTPTTALLSIASKTAGVIAMIRVFVPFLQEASPSQNTLMVAMGILAILTLLIGNLGAIKQTNLKRLMAYSSIGHTGFLLLIFASPTNQALAIPSALGLYLAAYLLMNLALFAVLVMVRSKTGKENVDALNGLYQKSPLLAITALIALASLAGVPLTVGFWGKFIALSLAIEAKLWLGVAAAIVAAIAGFYYYLKLALAIFQPASISDTTNVDGQQEPSTQETNWKLSPIYAAMLLILCLVMIGFGVFADAIKPKLEEVNPPVTIQANK